MPTYLNVLNNAILRANLPPSKGNPAAYGENTDTFTPKFGFLSGAGLGSQLVGDLFFFSFLILSVHVRVLLVLRTHCGAFVFQASH